MTYDKSANLAIHHAAALCHVNDNLSPMPWFHCKCILLDRSCSCRSKSHWCNCSWESPCGTSLSNFSFLDFLANQCTRDLPSPRWTFHILAMSETLFEKNISLYFCPMPVHAMNQRKSMPTDEKEKSKFRIAWNSLDSNSVEWTYFVRLTILCCEVITHNTIEGSTKSCCSIPNTLHCINLYKLLLYTDENRKNIAQHQLLNSTNNNAPAHKRKYQFIYLRIPCDGDGNLVEHYPHVHSGHGHS